jgi:hypothetical protein
MIYDYFNPHTWKLYINKKIYKHNFLPPCLYLQSSTW